MSSSFTRKSLMGIVVTLMAVGYAVLGQAGEKKKEQQFHVGKLEPKGLEESSGIIASRVHQNVFWTHNDSGNAPELFAVTGDGKDIRTFRVDAQNIDWEDIAYDEQGKILIADIGNNQHRRKEVYVHRVAEPDPTRAADAAHPQPPIRVEQTWTLKYPAEPFDAESLFVRGKTGYVISKLLTLESAVLYSFEIDPARPTQTLQRVCELPIRYPVTGADVSPDGKRLAVLTIAGPYLFDMPDNIAEINKAKPAHVLFTNHRMEAVCFVPEGLLVTTETREIFVFKWKDFGVSPARTK